MPLRIEESFEVEAPLALVGAHLGEPRELARCLPGAEVEGYGTDGSRAARMLLRVGPVRLAYAGTMRIEEKDDATHRLRVRAEGAGADGHAGLEVAIALDPAVARRTTVHVHAALDVTGRVTQFGPGMIEGVARQLLHDFAGCVRATLEPRASGADGIPTTDESLTLSGAYREHPMLRDTLTGVRAPVAPFTATTPTTPTTPPRNATAIPARRETARVALLPRLWRAVLERLRG
jgi:uncharacterized protein